MSPFLRRDVAGKDVPRDLAWWIVVAGMLGGLVGARLHLALRHWGKLALADVGWPILQRRDTR